MKNARKAIITDRFGEYKNNFCKNYTMGKESEWIKVKISEK